MRVFQILLSLMFLSGHAFAGTYRLSHASDCSLLGKQELFRLMNEVGIEMNLDLSTNFQISGVLRCFHHAGISQVQSPAYPYTFRATIEKQVSDAGRQRWVPVAEQTSYGVTDGAPAWLRELRQTTKNLIQQVR